MFDNELLVQYSPYHKSMVDFLVLGYYASDEYFFSLLGVGMHFVGCKDKRFFFYATLWCGNSLQNEIISNVNANYNEVGFLWF